MKEEYNSLIANNTWTLTDLPKGRNAVGSKWVFKVKYGSNGEILRYKARLVAQGYHQIYGVDYDEVFAPVVRQSTILTLLSIVGKRNLIVKQFDCKTAFLNGVLTDEIYMKQPQFFAAPEQQQLVCKLNKSIYGLKQSARCWNLALHESLQRYDFQQSAADSCLYYRCSGGDECYVIVYVDDILVAGTNLNIIDGLYTNLSKEFEMTYLDNPTNFLGMEISMDNDGNYQLCQSSYIHAVLSNFHMLQAKSSKIPMDPSYGKSEVTESLQSNVDYQKLIGCLLYIATKTRPDIAAAVSILARKVSCPNVEDWNECKRILRYLKGTIDAKLRMGRKNVSEILVGYADASWAETNHDRKSNTGYIFMVHGGVVSWTCKKQTSVALSSMEAEYIALSDACQEAIWLKKLLNDLGEDTSLPTTIWEDNQSCLAFIKTEKISKRSKHINVKMHFVKDHVDKGLINCSYCPTESMIADIMTKPLPATKFIQLRTQCGLLINE